MNIRFLALLFLLSGCSVFINNEYNFFVQNRFLATSEMFLDMHEKKDRKALKAFVGVDPARTEWCAAFVNSVLESNNVEGTGSFLARSFIDWGEPVDEPREGDIVVFERGEPWQGHVAFFVAEVEDNNRKMIVVLGGNQDDKVTYDAYDKRKVLAIRRAP